MAHLVLKGGLFDIVLSNIQVDFCFKDRRLVLVRDRSEKRRQADFQVDGGTVLRDNMGNKGIGEDNGILGNIGRGICGTLCPSLETNIPVYVNKEVLGFH